MVLIKKIRNNYVSIFFVYTNIGDYMDLINVFYRGIISLIVLFLTTKMIGKKQVSEMSVFDYVIGISIGNFAAEMTINFESNEINGIFAVVIFGIVAYLVSYLSIKSLRLRRFFMGKPTIIINKGNILKKNMKKANLDINEVLEEARINGYFDLSQIEYAIMEINGHISFLPYAKYQNLTPNDMNINTNTSGLCANVIIDGNILYGNLNNIGKNLDWLEKNLKKLGYQNIKDIFLCTVDSNEKLCVYMTNNNVKYNDIFE